MSRTAREALRGSIVASASMTAIKTLGRIGTWQDDLDPVQSLITLTTLLRPVPALTLADRFRLAYAAIYAAGRCSCRNPRCLG